MRGRDQEIVWRGLLPGCPAAFSQMLQIHSLLIFSFQSCSVGSLVRERVPFQMALSFEREM